MNNPVVDILKHDLHADLLKRIGKALPKFLTTKNARDSCVFINGCKELADKPVDCVFSYRQGFAAALEYIRDRINPNAASPKNTEFPMLDGDGDGDGDDYDSIYEKR